MEKNEIYDYVSSFIKTQEYILKWDRGNGVLEDIFLFDGFDNDKNPKLFFRESRAQLDIKAIGGYPSIISIEGLELDGIC